MSTATYKDPLMYHEGVLSYREQFNLVPNAGFRRDIAATIQTYEDLLLWQDVIGHWGYMKDGKWKPRNPLDVRGMLNVFDYRKSINEIQQREAVPERGREGISPLCDSQMFALPRRASGFKG